MEKVAMKILLFSVCVLSAVSLQAQKVSQLKQSVHADSMRLVEIFKDLHQNPELGFMEVRTSGIIAKELKALGYEVITGIGKTGVVGILKGGKPGPVVALRADMDGLPVKERAEIPFASKAMSEYNGQPVSVMHACGHDTHVAILMGTAEILAGMQKDLKGTVKFIFQPWLTGSTTA